MNCPKCGSQNVRAKIEVGMVMDADKYGAVTKKVISSTSTHLLFVREENTSFSCIDCMHAWGRGYPKIAPSDKTEYTQVQVYKKVLTEEEAKDLFEQEKKVVQDTKLRFQKTKALTGESYMSVVDPSDGVEISAIFFSPDSMDYKCNKRICNFTTDEMEQIGEMVKALNEGREKLEA